MAARAAKNIMIQGTMSNVGKSLLCAALCRVLHQDGYRCAPFKSQNMALNSGVTGDGLEMGRAQILQAAAAGIEPDVRMNPVLLKPTSDHRSQVIVNGEVLGDFTAREYFAKKKELIPGILEAYRSLEKENDVIVIEGAGSPAEINLKKDDIVNMGLAEMIDAPVLLVGDIDPGGVFAQLYGTVMLLEERERSRIKGLIINKFRGDVSLLEPGLKMLEEKVGIPVIGVLPYLPLDLDEEDSMASDLSKNAHDRPLDIAIIRFPRISNFTDFDPLRAHPMLGVRYVREEQEFGTPDLVILPGTKSTLSDLNWLRKSGLANRVREAAAGGTHILGICGGYQMLGEELIDPYGTEGYKDYKSTGYYADHSGDSGRLSMKTGFQREGDPGQLPMKTNFQTECGLGLLPVRTVFQKEKARFLVRGTIRDGFLAGANVYGYEIHTGKTQTCEDSNPRGRELHRADTGSDSISVCCRGNVCGTYLHGLFDSGEAVDLTAKLLAKKKGPREPSYVSDDRTKIRERQLDLLADAFRSNMDMDKIYRIIEVP